MDKHWYVSHDEVMSMASLVATKVEDISEQSHGKTLTRVYPIPRGGIPAAYAVRNYCHRIKIVNRPEDADCFIDDIIDSGRTRNKFRELYPATPFFALVDKLGVKNDSWIVWPWEGTSDGSIDDHITRLLQYVGEDSTREGLIETPRRVAKAWKQWCSGYGTDPASLLKVFEDGANGVDEMVVVKNIRFYSHCEHHLAPFFGTASIAYIPNGKIVGLSKLARLTDCYARRLQVQERLTNQIADALWTNLNPKGVGVIIKARHMCIESRGADKQDSETVSSALRGVIKDKPEARMEFLELVK